MVFSYFRFFDLLLLLLPLISSIIFVLVARHSTLNISRHIYRVLFRIYIRCKYKHAQIRCADNLDDETRMQTSILYTFKIASHLLKRVRAHAFV